MAIKLFIFTCLFSVALAGLLPYYAQPVIRQYQPTVVKEIRYAAAPEAPANYDFNYDVHDTQTGDVKQQSESASNGVISGQYSLIDADGYRRIVDYTADDVHGFNANVRREPLQVQVVKKIVAQPVLTKIIAAPAQPQYYQSYQPVQAW